MTMDAQRKAGGKAPVSVGKPAPRPAVAVSTKPKVGGTAKPIGGTAKPIGGTAKPIGGTVKSVGGTVKPIGGTAKPVVTAAGKVAPPKESPPRLKTPSPARVSEPVPPAEVNVEEAEVEERAVPSRKRASAGSSKGGSRWLLIAILLLVVAGGGVAFALKRGGAGGDSGGSATDSLPGTSEASGGSTSGSPAVAIAPVTKEAFPSPIGVTCSPDGKTLYFSAHTSFELLVVDVATGKVTKSIALPDRPGDLAMSSDGTRLFAAIASPSGKIVVVDTVKQEVAATVSVGHTPTGLALSRDGKRLYVCNRFNGTVSVIDLGTCKETGRNVGTTRTDCIGGHGG